MSVNPEFENFINSWLEKAQHIQLSDLSSHFDRFFTLYVVYNRLYAETTFILARKGSLNLEKRTSFPDREAATSYVCKFFGSSNLIQALENDLSVRDALRSIEKLIDCDNFSIKLNMVTGARQREKDEELLARLRSNECNKKAEAILETIYSIRCNMFHGHKGFELVQTEILAPVIIILEKLIILLRAKM